MLLIVFFAALAWSVRQPREYFTWALEATPAIIGVGLLCATYRRFRFTSLVYVLACIHALILLIGAHYTCAEVPLFNWLRDALSRSRNHYDRIGHLAQGFIPAIIARELLLRTSPLRRGRWLAAVVTGICLAISALYELLEWTAAGVLGQAADAFLGTQGDPWDTQEDMGLALVGAVAAQILLRGLHDRQLRAIEAAATDRAG